MVQVPEGRQIFTRLTVDENLVMGGLRRRSGAGAHQLALPARRMNAGTRTARMRVASRMTARARPSPNSLMKVTWEVAKARKTTASKAAAAVTMRPVRSSPRATDDTLSPEASYSSLMRESRKTS